MTLTITQFRTPEGNLTGHFRILVTLDGFIHMEDSASSYKRAFQLAAECLTKLAAERVE
jgi:hypothetical protein